MSNIQFCQQYSSCYNYLETAQLAINIINIVILFSAFCQGQLKLQLKFQLIMLSIVVKDPPNHHPPGVEVKSNLHSNISVPQLILIHLITSLSRLDATLHNVIYYAFKPSNNSYFQSTKALPAFSQTQPQLV